ncbi:DUF6197 family protein [Mycobacteroides abscessus]|uniref:DUF6197 family protein n=1 Tax=Mycobacteroides abscessus TaxID=36809 RepID=UPI000C257D19|nr:hypothetical protein [Mycobacteroides abscessus]
MSSKVKEILEERIESLDYDISWYERVLSEQQDAVTDTAKQLDDYRAEREEIQAHIEENFPKDVVLEQLQKTREVLEERGRGTGALISAMTGKVCLLGAVGVAVAGEDFRSEYAGDGYEVFKSGKPAFDVVAGLAEQIVALKKDPRIPPVISATPAETVYRFNDRGATDEDVFEVIDRAIEARKAAA